MPRKPIDYSKTYFYKIVCKDTSITDCYVGHTTDFTKRKSQHKNTCNNPNIKKHNLPVYQFIRMNDGWENFEMILINTHSLNSSLEARQKEREYIEQIQPVLNKYLPYTSKEEKNKYMKEWANENSQHIKEYKHKLYIEKQDEYKEKKQRTI